MDGIRSYFGIIDPRFLQRISGKSGEFIKAAKEGNFISEEAFIHHICGEEKERNYYRNLKSRAIKMLQALAIISDSKGISLVKKKYDFCQRNFSIGQKFLTGGERKEGIRLIKLAYREAVK